MKEPKKKRNKAGWRETDRLCRLCGKEITKEQSLNKHHLSYALDFVIPLHYNCHNVLHGRVKFHCPFDKQYGVDHAPYFRSLAIFNLYKKYPEVMNEIKTKWGDKHANTETDSHLG